MASAIFDVSRKFAVKSFDLRKLKGIERDHVKGELATFFCMDHPHVARLVDAYEIDHMLHLVMECIQGGELFDRLASKHRFGEEDAANAMRQILLAVNYLHSHGTVHRDLKLENFLYESEGSDHLKLIDFGFSKFFKGEQGRFNSTCGTISYIAPEVLTGSYGNQCDLWSAGVIGYVLLSGGMPFYGSGEEKMKQISQGNYEMKHRNWKTVSDAAKDFVKGLLNKDPAVRMTAPDALAHKWMLEGCKKLPSIDDPQKIAQALKSWSRAPKLRRACMTLMAWNLFDEDRVSYRDWFLALDLDHNGAISLAELQKLFVETCKMDEDEADEIFASLSHTDQAEIYYSDFVAAIMSETDVEFADELLRTTFRKFDKSNTGKITPSDFVDIVGEEYDGTCSRSLILDADTISKDGEIDYDEFVHYVRKSGKGKRAKKSAASGASDLNGTTDSSTKVGPKFSAPDNILCESYSSSEGQSSKSPKAHGKSSKVAVAGSDQDKAAQKACCSLM